MKVMMGILHLKKKIIIRVRGDTSFSSVCSLTTIKREIGKDPLSPTRIIIFWPLDLIGHNFLNSSIDFYFKRKFVRTFFSCVEGGVWVIDSSLFLF